LIFVCFLCEKTTVGGQTFSRKSTTSIATTPRNSEKSHTITQVILSVCASLVATTIIMFHGGSGPFQQHFHGGSGGGGRRGSSSKVDTTKLYETLQVGTKQMCCCWLHTVYAYFLFVSIKHTHTSALNYIGEKDCDAEGD
jgi:hypothetical protein